MEDEDKLENPGDAFFTTNNKGEKQGLEFVCPCGCGDKSYIPFTNTEYSTGGEAWDWNGNETEPTLSPSLQRVGGCEYHGHLRSGVFVEC